MKPFVVGMAFLVASPAALAQPAPGPVRPDPREAREPVPPAQYRSPFAQYRPFAAQPPGSWREVNDRVGRIGGWKVYARESAESSSPPPSAPAPKPEPK